VEAVDRSFGCGLKVSFSCNEADVCTTEGRRSCLSAVSLCSVSGGVCLALLLLVDVSVSLNIIAECNSGLILRIMPPR